MGKKDFIMNSNPLGHISPDNPIAIERILSLVNQGKSKAALEEIEKLDLRKDDPDYYLIRGLSGFVHLAIGAESDDDGIALKSARRASSCFHDAFDHGAVLPDMLDAMEFSDKLIAGDFDSLDGEYDPMGQLSRTIMSSMPLISSDSLSDGGDVFTAVIRIADEMDISVDDFRDYLSQTRHLKVRKKKGTDRTNRFTLSGIDCSLEKLPQESPEDPERLWSAIEKEEIPSDFDSADGLSQCLTVIRISLHKGSSGQDGSIRGMCFASLIESIIASVPAQSVEVFGYLYDAAGLISAFDGMPTPLLMMEILPVPCVKTTRKGYSFRTEGFRCYGLPELSGRIVADDLFEACDCADMVITEIMKYSVLFRYGVMPDGRYVHVSGLVFTVNGVKDRLLDIDILQCMG